LFLLGLFNLVPFITWLFRTTAIPDRKFGGSNKPLRISVSFQQLFGGTPNPTSWAVVMSMITGIVCFIYSGILAAFPVQTSVDFLLAIALVIIVIPTLFAFGYDVSYMQTDMYSGALERVGTFFTTGRAEYLQWIATPFIFGFSSVGTIVTSLIFLYLAYYLISRQPNYVQLAGKRRW
jgi:hypothetical protein